MLTYLIIFIPLLLSSFTIEFSKPLVCRDYIDVVGQVISFNDRVLKIKFEVLKVLDGVSEEYLLITNMVCKAVCIFEVLRN